jgi:hypothetical protein
LNKWKKKSFPLYDSISGLVSQSTANGKQTFHPGRIQDDSDHDDDRVKLDLDKGTPVCVSSMI